MKHLVLIGGGHAHALVLKRWAKAPLANVRLTLVDPVLKPSYTGMLPGYVAGHYTRAQLDIDLPALAKAAGGTLITAAANRIDADRRRIGFDGHPQLTFDVASIDIGAHNRMPTRHEAPSIDSVPLKPLAAFATAWDGYVERVRAAPTDRVQSIVIVGGGVGGIEIAFAMTHRLTALGALAPAVSILDASKTPLAGLHPRQRRHLIRKLTAAGIEYLPGRRVHRIENRTVFVEDGTTYAADFIVSAVGAQAHPWLAECGLPTTHGFLNVDRFLRCGGEGSPVFAAGDCAHMIENSREKAGVFAVRQAPVLHNNLRAALGHGALAAFEPQRDYLKIVSLGRKSATALKFGHAVSSGLLWTLKDQIDRRFMDALR
ncbi:MAG: FAD-dependent oxidoreductase [Pseudomonadota bacterium]